MRKPPSFNEMIAEYRQPDNGISSVAVSSRSNVVPNASTDSWQHASRNDYRNSTPYTGPKKRFTASIREHPPKPFTQKNSTYCPLGMKIPRKYLFSKHSFSEPLQFPGRSKCCFGCTLPSTNKAPIEFESHLNQIFQLQLLGGGNIS